jgi:hypothetical protein
MNRLELYKAQLKTAKAVLTQRRRTANAANRAVVRLEKSITLLEKKIEPYLA